MKLLPERTVSSILLLIALAAMLLGLAALQYKWSGQVSKAEQQRMQTSLLASADQFRLQLNSELRQPGFLLQPDTAILLQRGWKPYAAHCDAVLSRPDHRLVRNIFLWVTGSNLKAELYRLNRGSKEFEIAPWPSSFLSVRDRYSRFFFDPRRPEPGLMPFTWRIFPGIPLMLQPLIARQVSPGMPGPGIQFVGCLLLELNGEIILKELLPQLARRYFEGPDGFIYQIAVAERGREPGLVYRSDPQLTMAEFERPDVRISLFESPPERLDPMAPEPGRRPDPLIRRNSETGQGPLLPRLSQGKEPGLPPPYQGEAGPDRRPLQQEQLRRRPLSARLLSEPPPAQERFYLSQILFDDAGDGWELMAKHREGSLEVAVAGMRRRNLAISMGTLLLLAASMAFIMISARRAQRLARLQIDFVARISHELRTPLAVICSAGDNLAEGVTENSSQATRKYGGLIRSEGRKLAGMIDQILQFASLQRSRRRFNLHPENINWITESALRPLQPAIEAAGFSLEKEFAEDLPPIQVDAAALAQVIQNLVQNALKYSGDSRWLALRTTKAAARRGTEVQLTVEDRGLGMGGEDIPQIFKPFYRGSAAAAAQIHGTGLGLFVVRETLISMGASISVKSAPGKGSVFTMHFPALPAAARSLSSAASEENAQNAV